MPTSSFYGRSSSASRSSRAASVSSAGSSLGSSVGSIGGQHHATSMLNLRRSGAGSASGSAVSSRGHRPRAGSSSFHVGRERDRSAEMELFSQARKPRSNFRRPSSLGLAKAPLTNQSEARLQYQAKPSGRSHIVPRTPDHLKPEGSFVKDTELRANYRNFSPARPIIYKLQDHLKPEGVILAQTETAVQYENKNPTRPVIFRLKDHTDDVQPRGTMADKSEYRNNFAKVVRGDRVTPAWLNNFEKVTIDGTDTTRQ